MVVDCRHLPSLLAAKEQSLPFPQNTQAAKAATSIRIILTTNMTFPFLGDAMGSLLKRQGHRIPLGTMNGPKDTLPIG